MGLIQEPSRRDVLRFIGVGVATAAMAPIVSASLAFADGGGGGSTGGDSGNTGPDSQHGDAGRDFIWFDRGGFKDRPDFQPVQGWGEDSIEYFKNLMSVQRGNRRMSTRPRAAGQNNDWYYYTAARQAIANAKNRAETDYARLVAVGYTYVEDDENDGNGVYCFQTSWEDRTYSSLIKRAGNATELPDVIDGKKVGWGDVVDRPDAAGQNWRQYAHAMGRRDSSDASGREYADRIVVAVAIADAELPSTGYLRVRKQLNI